MSNEELVAAIQTGEDRWCELWEQVAGLVKWKANHIMSALDLRGNPCGVEFHDLYQSGYLAMVAAVESYDPAAGAFSTWFMYRLKTVFAEVTGYRTKKGQLEPLNSALSMDSPLTDDADSALFGDFIPDQKAAATMQDVEERLWQEQLHEAMEAALAALPEQSAEVLRLRYYQRLTYADIGEIYKKSWDRIRQIENKAIRQLRKPNTARHLRPFYNFDFYYGISLGTFRNTGMSVQERYLIVEEELQEQEEQRRKEREAKRQKEKAQKEVQEMIERIHQEAQAKVASMTPEEKAELLAKYGYT